MRLQSAMRRATGVSHRAKRQRSERTGARGPGMIMLDCLIYLGLVMMVLGLATAGFYAVLKNTTRLHRNAADILRAVQAGERWREDVRRASSAPEIFEWLGQPALHIRQPTGEVVYFWQADTVYRATGTNTPIAFLTRVKDSRLAVDQRRRVTSCRWEVELHTYPGMTNHLKPLFTFQAAPVLAPP